MNNNRLSRFYLLCQASCLISLSIGGVNAAPNHASQDWGVNHVNESIETKTYSVNETGPSGVGTVGWVTDGGKHGVEYYVASKPALPWFQTSVAAGMLVSSGKSLTANWTVATSGQLFYLYNAGIGCLGATTAWVSDLLGGPTNNFAGTIQCVNGAWGGVIGASINELHPVILAATF